MTHRIALLAAFGSFALLTGAFFFQYGMGLQPCKMCYWQRYPHGVAAFLGGVILIAPLLWVKMLGAVSASITSFIGFYHAGVEKKWWEGPQSCTSGDIQNLSTDALFEKILNAPVVRCDDIPWEFLNISMAGWNGILSLSLAFLWLYSAFKE